MKGTNDENKPLIPVKFNKQTIMLDVEQAAVLAQKGMKYDSISEDIARLKKLAEKRNLNIKGFIDRLEDEDVKTRREQLLNSGANEELVEHILSLEGNTEKIRGMDELTEYFPEIDSFEKLPESVKENAEISGTRVLDEYLRYLLSEQKHIQTQNKNNLKVKKASVGSQITAAPSAEPANLAFLQAIWNS